MIVDWLLVGCGFAMGALAASLVWYTYTVGKSEYLKKRVSYWRQLAADESRKVQHQERLADGWRDYAVGTRETPPAAEPWEEESVEIAELIPPVEIPLHSAGAATEIVSVVGELPATAKLIPSYMPMSVEDYMNGLLIGEASRER